MRFDPIDTFDPARQTTGPVARPRRWPSLVAAVVTGAIGVPLLIFGTDWAFRFGGGLMLILFCAIFARVSRSLGATRAWLVAVDSQGLSVMLRSPFRTPADAGEASVVTLPWREIEWIRAASEVTPGQSASGKAGGAERYRYLDVAVRDVDVAELAAKVEAAFETPSNWKNAHRQSTFVEGNVLRLQFSGPSVSMTPSLKAVLRAIEGKTTVREELKIG